MIKIDFYLAIGVYLSVMLIAALSYFAFSREKPGKDSSLDERSFWYCNVCLYTYVSTTLGAFSHCPRCGSINQKRAG